MIEFIERNGHVWAPSDDEDERVGRLERLAGGQVPEAEFAEWVRDSIRIDE
jgi:hypothetical protein